MTASQLLTNLVLLRRAPYRHAREHSRSGLWVSGFLIATGLQYGLWMAIFQRMLDGDIKGIPVAQISDGILLAGNLISGVLIVLFFHGGVTLVVWLMARAVGGPGRLAELYRASAYALLLSWPALPSLALHGAALGTPVSHLPEFGLYTLLALLSFALMCCGFYQLLRETQYIVPWRAASGVFLTIMFCYSILLLTGNGGS